MTVNLKLLQNIVSVGLGAFVATAALAQTTQSSPANAPQARAQTRFQAADTNKDGSLSKEEAEKGMPGMARRFASLDTNQDGKISAEEFATMRAGARAHQGMGPGSSQPGMQAKGARSKGSQLCTMKANADGSIERADVEKMARPKALSRFDALDTNKDGKLSADERATCPANKR